MLRIDEGSSVDRDNLNSVHKRFPYLKLSKLRSQVAIKKTHCIPLQPNVP